MRRNIFPGFFLGISLFGIFVAIAMTLNPSPTPDNFSWRKPVFGSALALICLLGALAVIFPNECSRKVGFTRNKSGARSKFVFCAHHPNCESYSLHVLHVGGKKICAGCTGLFVGALAAFIGTILYFFLNFSIGQNSLLISWVGSVGVILGLVYPAIFSMLLSYLRSFFNAFFAFGAFLVMAGIDEINQSISADSFLILLVVFWIFTKIWISRWDHDRICKNCKVEKCELRAH